MIPLFHHPGRARFPGLDSFLTRPRRRTASSPLLRDLVAHWRLDETSGPRCDALGRHNLAPNGSPARAEGKLDFATQFDPASSDYLSAVSHADLQPGNGDFTVGGWCLFDSVPGAPLLGKAEPGSLEYLLACEGSNLAFSVSSDGTSVTSVSAASPLEPASWYFFLAWHDALDESLNLSLNGGPPAVMAHSSGIGTGGADLHLGRNGLTGAFLSGRLDSVSIWKRVLSAGERDWLYNNGAGRPFPF